LLLLSGGRSAPILPMRSCAHIVARPEP
jgi:hypothetical protein